MMAYKVNKLTLVVFRGKLEIVAMAGRSFDGQYNIPVVMGLIYHFIYTFSLQINIIYLFFINLPQFPSHYNYLLILYGPTMDNEEDNEVQHKKKEIIFRNPYTKEIVARVKVPSFIQLGNNQWCNIDGLGNRLKMLYADVLSRGYHPAKKLQVNALNVFKPASENKIKKFSTVSEVEAMGTIWRCLSRQIGRPPKIYDLNGIKSQILNYLQNTKKKRLKGRKVSKKFKQKLLDIENEIEKEFFKINRRLQEQQKNQKQSQKMVASVLGDQILELERQIFCQSMIGVRQCQDNMDLVQILLEQCFPSIKMPKTKAIQMLGEETFVEKWKFYQNLQQKYHFTEENPPIICHRCFTILSAFGRVHECEGKCASLEVGHTILTDPYMYNSTVLNENCLKGQTRKFIHPYLVYYRANDNKTALCNRSYCNQCLGLQLHLSSDGNCNYCEGVCDCFRCQNMDLLTKMMAIFLDNHGDLELLTNKFMMRFDQNSLTHKRKDKIMIDSDEYIQCFLESKIMVPKSKMERYIKQSFKAEENTKKDKKYKMRILDIGQSAAQRSQRLEKDRKKNREIERLNSLLVKNKKNPKQIMPPIVEQKKDSEQAEGMGDCYFDDSED